MTNDARVQHWFSLSPVDSWFFGDGRPNNAGENQAGIASLFPPPAPTVVGAIRAAAARAMGWRSGPWPVEVRKQLGDGDDLGPLRFTGPFLARTRNGTREVLFPAPAHLLGTVDADTDGWTPADLLAPGRTPVRTDLADTPVPLPEPIGLAGEGATLKPPEGIWLTADGLSTVLAGRLPDSGECCAAGELFVFEPRVGLEREAATRTAKEGGLYSPVHVRLRRGVSVVVGVSGLPDDFDPAALLPFGGESRLAQLEPVDPPQMPVASAAVNGSGIPALILLTPARLLDGEEARWRVPRPGDPGSNLVPSLAGRIESLCLSRPERIGGWDSVQRRPRPLTPFVPAGTVWFLTDADNAASELRIGDQTDFGFGHLLAGRVPALSPS